MSETRVNQTPAHEMSIEERLNEIAALMLRGVKRLKNKSNKETGSTGLACELKHSCDQGDRNNDRKTNDHAIGDTAEHGNA